MIGISMSFDLGVWSSNSRVVGSRAGQIYERLCRGERPPDLQPDSNIGVFYRELTSRWPEIDSVPDEQVDDKDVCPWSSALDHSDVHVLMSCVWPAAEKVYGVVQQLAQKHGLVTYDPQSDEMHAPEAGAGNAEDLSR
jgi:hypothetical protein